MLSGDRLTGDDSVAYYWTDNEEDGCNDNTSWQDVGNEPTVTVLESGRDGDDDDGTRPPGHVFPQIEGEPWLYNDEDTGDDDEPRFTSQYRSMALALADGLVLDGS